MIYILLVAIYIAAIATLTLGMMVFASMSVDQALGNAIALVSIPTILIGALGAHFFGEKRPRREAEWVMLSPGKQVKKVL